jgi:hypothetical protein
MLCTDVFWANAPVKQTHAAMATAVEIIFFIVFLGIKGPKSIEQA